MRRRVAPALGLLFGLVAGCNGIEPVPGSSPGSASAVPSPAEGATPEHTATARSAISANEVLSRADEWVALAVPYCGGVNGGTDYICGGTCNRPAAPWDDFRTDCSGFVSWCWQIASDPTTDTYMVDHAGDSGWSTIPIDDLAPGDAIVCDGHIKLFSQWISDSEAEIYEEYDCGKVARKATQSFTRSGNNLFFSGDSRTYHPIRRNGIEPLAAVKGYLDAASVYVKGWAADTKAPETPLSVDVAFDGAPGEGFTRSIVASDPRPDVGDALGIDPNHGFALLTPLFYCDGAEHVAHAVGHAVEDGAPVALTGSPKTFTCPIAVTPKGALRPISTAAVDAFRFSRPADLRWMTKEDHATHPESEAWPSSITIGRTSDGKAWLVDGMTVRRIPSDDAMSAWRFDASDIVTWSSADLAKFKIGQALPEVPLLASEVGDARVYVLDADPDAPVEQAPPGADGPTSAGADPAGATNASVGCSVDATTASPPVGFALAAFAIGALARRRRAASR